MATKWIKDKKKNELNEIAESTELPDYKNMKKEELVSALDSHLSANQTTYSGRPELAGYYDNKKSPVKKAIDKVLAPVTSDDDKPKSKGRRKTTTGATAESAAADAGTLVTQARESARRTSSSIVGSQPLATPSKAITDMVDAGRRRVTSSVSQAYERTQLDQWAELARENLSSPAAISTIATLLEAWYLRAGILPNKKVFELPAVPFVSSQKTNVYGPDLFLLLTPEFWAPFTCWFLTNLLLPLTIASLINLSNKASSSHGYGTRRASSSSTIKVDPFMYFVAKGLLAYLVYHNHAIVGLFSNFTISTVNESIYGGYGGMITSAGIGAAASLYEAVLKK